MIEKSKSNEAWQLLTGFGIPNVGKAAAKSILKKFPNIQALMAASLEELTAVNDIGQVSAGCIRDYFDDEKNQRIIERLVAAGVNMESGEQQTGGRFEGMTFVITGTLPGMDRKEAQALVEANGGKVSGSVSKKTTYLLAGENAGSKLTKAQELGTNIIDETGFRKMME